jgi:hypothetical protein
MPLKHFNGQEIKITQNDAFAVLRFFWMEPGVLPQQLTNEDLSFAQALLVEAIDRSYDMGFVELIFRNFYGKIPSSFEAIRNMVKSFAKAAAKHWFEHATNKDLENPKIYESIRYQLAANFRSVWQIRLLTGELTY